MGAPRPPPLLPDAFSFFAARFSLRVWAGFFLGSLVVVLFVAHGPDSEGWTRDDPAVTAPGRAGGASGV